MRFLFCAVDGAQGINGQNQFVHTTDWTQSFEDWLKEDQQTISNYKTPELLTTVIRDFATDTGRTIDQKLISTFVEKQFSANAAADTAQGVGGAQGTAAYLTSNMENPELKEKTQATLDNIQNILNQKPVDTQELKAELKTLAGQLGFSGGMQDYLSTYLDKLSDRSIIDLCTAKLNGGTLIGKLDSVVFEHIDGLSERQIYQELAWYSDIKNPDRINTADPEEIKRLVERLLESKLESGKITPENIEKFKANFQTLVTAALEEFSKGDRTALTKFAALLCSKEATDGLINELCTRDPVTFANKMNAGVSRGRTSYDLVITSLIKGIVAGQIGEDVLRHYMDDNKYMVTANIFIRVMSNPNFERLSPEGKAVALMGGDGQKTSPDFSALPEADQKILAEMFPEIQAYRKESQEQFEYEVRTGERNLSEEDNDFLVEKAERDAENQEADAAFFDQEPYKSKFPGLGDVFRNAAAQSRAFGNNIVDAFNTQRQIKNQQERQVAGLDSAAAPATSSAGGGASTAISGGTSSLSAAIERLLKAANAEEAKAELANVRAELHKLDERIEENNKNANKLFAQELDKAAQEKLESELVEQKAAVQILFELCDLAESLYSAEGVENTDTLRQTLSALAELVQWIAPRLENEIKTSAELLQRTFAGADKAASAPTDDLRNFYKEQISRQINEQIENKYQVNLELKQTEAQARLFDIFVDLAFTPVVSEKFLPDLQAVSTFIQKARTLAETIRLDKIFQNIANENTQAAVEEFRLELEKISALPGLQIVMGWKTLLEVREAEWELAAGEINPLKAGRKLTEAREKLAANNLPGMLTVWESLDEQEKQYQKTFIKEKLEGGLSVNELAEILNLNSEALPLELRALVKTALENKIEKLRDTSALQELPVEKLKALLSILSGNGLSAAYDIVQDAIDKKEKTTNPQPEPVTA